MDLVDSDFLLGYDSERQNKIIDTDLVKKYDNLLYDNTMDYNSKEHMKELSLVWPKWVDIKPKEGVYMMMTSIFYEKSEDDFNDCCGDPADALFFALGYLSLQDLLSVEMVCKSLCEAVRNDPLLWRNIHISYRLQDKITNDNLLKLINRAKGSLHSLSLIKCSKITDYGLKQVLQSNLQLSKLSVTGCKNISVQWVLHQIEAFNSVVKPGIKRLRISGLEGIITDQLFNEFKVLIGADHEDNYPPRFYILSQTYLSPDGLYLPLHDARAIDVEPCPRCHKVKQVYSCTGKNCQVEFTSVQKCKACLYCIDRCFKCGCCSGNEGRLREGHCSDCYPAAAKLDVVQRMLYALAACNLPL